MAVKNSKRSVTCSVVLFLGFSLSGCFQGGTEESPVESSLKDATKSDITKTASTSAATINASSTPGTSKGIYEASAAQQLPDGSVLVLEDESAYALNLVTLDAAGRITENDKQDKRLVKAFREELDDMEAITLGKDGEVYATTSFSRTKKGKRRQSREQILHFRIKDNEVISGSSYVDFGDHLRDSDIFDALRHDNNGKKVDLDDMNIEALSFDAKKQQLWFGFREPLVDGKSMIVRLENPDQVFSGQSEPRFSKDISLLDLNGGGIRSLEYDARLGAFLIASEAKIAGQWRSQLWLWSGESQQSPQALDIPVLQTMKNIEALTPVVIDGVAKILLMSDDGNRNKEEPGHYLLLGYDQLGLGQ